MPPASIVTHRLETTRKCAGELSVDDPETLGLIRVLRLSNRMSVYGPDFVAIDFQPTGTPPVAPLSLGSCVSNAIDSAVVRLFDFGVVVAAGNEGLVHSLEELSPSHPRNEVIPLALHRIEKTGSARKSKAVETKSVELAEGRSQQAMTDTGIRLLDPSNRDLLPSDEKIRRHHFDLPSENLVE
ncbi:hypothetical protein BJ322DRAFT_1206716 [Thelephora terrestris]|uniref:Uncharacterized protein n=1 Tax=Thelephora terrestris TaxID=56493 RepID=A0A9P6HNY0_9AGAM|nr:hypothetical protein BJ322DRAFT_1206716 [Thelephora terrestris]